MWFSGEGALAEQYLEFDFPVELTVFVNFGHYFFLQYRARCGG